MREVFVDESSQNGHAFMVLGAMVVPGHAVAAYEAAITAILEVATMFGEVKWTKVSRSKLEVYRHLAAEHFRLVTSLRTEYHAMTIENP